MIMTETKVNIDLTQAKKDYAYYLSYCAHFDDNQIKKTFNQMFGYGIAVDLNTKEIEILEGKRYSKCPND